jgi:hypothetical protein
MGWRPRPPGRKAGAHFCELRLARSWRPASFVVATATFRLLFVLVLWPTIGEDPARCGHGASDRRMDGGNSSAKAFRGEEAP